MRGQARAEAAPWGAWGSPHVPEAALSLLPQAWATIYTLGSAGSLTRGRGTEPNLNLEAAKKGQAVTCPGPHGGALQLSPPQGGAGDQDPQGQPAGSGLLPSRRPIHCPLTGSSVPPPLPGGTSPSPPLLPRKTPTAHDLAACQSSVPSRSQAQKAGSERGGVTAKATQQGCRGAQVGTSSA